MKIAFLLLSGGVINRGAEHSIHLLAEDLASLGHRVTLFQSGAPLSSAYKVIHIKLPFHATVGHTTKLGKLLERLYLDTRGLTTLLFSLLTLPKLRQTHFDLIIPVDGFWEIVISKLATLGRETKVAVIGMAGIGWTDRDNLRLHPDLFIALSDEALRWARTIHKDGKLKSLPLQVDTFTFSPKVKKAPIPLKKPIILCVAALTKYKRIDRVINAVAKIPRISLLVLGSGEEEASLHELGQQLLGNRYRQQAVSFTELPAFYAAADVFTLASEPQEAFGKVIVEALASGLPVVVPDDPIRREIAGKAGVYTDPTDTTRYASALKNALTKKNLDYYRKRAKRFDRRKVAKEYEEVFLDLIKSK